MNAETIDLVLETPNPDNPPKNVEIHPHREPEYIPIPISRFEWVELKQDSGEFNYLESFKAKHSKDKLELEKLDLVGSKVDVIEKLMKSYAKDGVLMSKKNAQDAYDLEDGWVDDSVEVGQGKIALNQIEPKFEDFVCHPGGIESFKKSKYYEERISLASSINDSKKKSKSSKGVKKSTKDPRRKAEEPLARPTEEVKKVKKNKDERDDSIIIDN